MDSISEARLQLVWPLLSDKIHTLSDMLSQESIDVRVVQGMRSWSEQDDLYAQGRTSPGPVVTKCKGGDSYHNFGMAVDCVPSQFAPDQSYNPDWNASHPSWKRMEAIALSLGLTVGADFRTFPDNPHFQLTGRFPVGAPDGEVQQLFKDGGMQAIWDEAGSASV